MRPSSSAAAIEDAGGKAVNKSQMNITWAALDRAPGHLTSAEKRLAMSCSAP